MVDLCYFTYYRLQKRWTWTRIKLDWPCLIPKGKCQIIRIFHSLNLISATPSRPVLCAIGRFAIRSSQYVPYILTTREESEPQNAYGNNPPQGWKLGLRKWNCCWVLLKQHQCQKLQQVMSVVEAEQHLTHSGLGLCRRSTSSWSGMPHSNLQAVEQLQQLKVAQQIGL
jgi:hypothetical protein